MANNTSIDMVIKKLEEAQAELAKLRMESPEIYEKTKEAAVMLGETITELALM